MLILNAFFRGTWVAIPVCFLWAIAAEFTGWEWMAALLPFVFLVCVMVGVATVVVGRSRAGATDAKGCGR